ncbi:MAG: hypothetical protein ACYTXC_21140 [Nostoc sp.]
MLSGDRLNKSLTAQIRTVSKQSRTQQRFATVCCKGVVVRRSLTIELMIRLYVA